MLGSLADSGFCFEPDGFDMPVSEHKLKCYVNEKVFLADAVKEEFDLQVQITLSARSPLVAIVPLIWP